MENILKNEKIYFTYFLDFRGRIYATSQYSPISSKLYRYAFSFGEYSKDEIGMMEGKIRIESFMSEYYSLVDPRNIYDISIKESLI
jgi:hypothetical protein